LSINEEGGGEKGRLDLLHGYYSQLTGVCFSDTEKEVRNRDAAQVLEQGWFSGVY
jgi:hypothetical protein